MRGREISNERTNLFKLWHRRYTQDRHQGKYLDRVNFVDMLYYSRSHIQHMAPFNSCQSLPVLRCRKYGPPEYPNGKKATERIQVNCLSYIQSRVFLNVADKARA